MSVVIHGVPFTVGADPEVFVSDKGEFSSAHGLVKGTKDAPHQVEKGAVQVDGMALEFNIDPAGSKEEFFDNISSVQRTLKGMIGDKELITNSSVEFTEEFLKSVPKEALVLGCDPDYNGWTGEANPRPDAGMLLRTAGGHVHIGGWNRGPVTKEVHKASARLARVMDEEVGLYSLLWDYDDKRREMYGQAGAFRPKTYGMEYRSLSNAWIFKEELIKFVFDASIRAARKMFDPTYEPDPVVQEVINNSDRRHKLLSTDNPRVRHVLKILENSRDELHTLSTVS